MFSKLFNALTSAFTSNGDDAYLHANASAYGKAMDAYSERVNDTIKTTRPAIKSTYVVTEKYDLHVDGEAEVITERYELESYVPPLHRKNWFIDFDDELENFTEWDNRYDNSMYDIFGITGSTSPYYSDEWANIGFDDDFANGFDFDEVSIIDDGF